MITEYEIYAAVGGDAPFFELVERFYERVERNKELRALYPADLEPGKAHLAWFLIQRFGGPDRFSAQRGAPRLRQRHAPFAITMAGRNAWFECMADALMAVDAFVPHFAVMAAYFDSTATLLINCEEPASGRVRLS